MPTFALSRSDGDGGVVCGCTGCPTTGAIDIVLSGLVSCGCAAGVEVSLSGLNGTHTLDWDAGNSWFSIAAVGSYTADVFAGSDCAGAPTDSGSGSFDIRAACSGDLWQIRIDTNGYIGIFPVFRNTSNSQPFDVAIPNEDVCGGAQFAGDGTATLSETP